MAPIFLTAVWVHFFVFYWNHALYSCFYWNSLWKSCLVRYHRGTNRLTNIYIGSRLRGCGYQNRIFLTFNSIGSRMLSLTINRRTCQMRLEMIPAQYKCDRKWTDFMTYWGTFECGNFWITCSYRHDITFLIGFIGETIKSIRYQVLIKCG